MMTLIAWVIFIKSINLGKVSKIDKINRISKIDKIKSSQ